MSRRIIEISMGLHPHQPQMLAINEARREMILALLKPHLRISLNQIDSLHRHYLPGLTIPMLESAWEALDDGDDLQDVANALWDQLDLPFRHR